MLTLTVPEHAYFYGFAQGDGHLQESSRNRGRFTIELSSRDRELLEKFRLLFECNSTVSNRTRNTNFKKNYTTSTFRICDWAFRKELLDLGYQVGRKSRIVTPPICEFSETDYFRGVIDADGSLGMTAQGFPFISLVTPSDNIANWVISFISSTTGKSRKKLKRNVRDNIYNIMITKEDAVLLASMLYYDGCLAMERKRIKAKEIMVWSRPLSMRKMSPRKLWDKAQDDYILSHSIKESMSHLGRSKQSVSMRLWRLKRS